MSIMNDDAAIFSFGSAMNNQFLRFALLVALTLTSISVLAESAGAQLLNKARNGHGSNPLIQYSPDDPSTRNRLFNLQTGHAGAFYNCDGEENKRNSPYICWKNGPCREKLHCTFLDILDWRKDKCEIAQRICDGAGACCNGGNCGAARATVVESATACGCSECLAAAKVTASGARVASTSNTAPVSLLKKAYATLDSNQLRLRPRTSAAGLVETTQRAAEVSRSVLQRSVTPTRIAKAARTAKSKAACDCATCRAKRSGSPTVAAKAPSQKPVAASRSASLLDRARSSRSQR